MRRKGLAAAAGILCIALLSVTVTAAMIQKGLTGWYGLPRPLVKDEAVETETETSMLTSALREYFGLDEGEVLTDEMLSEVTSVRFSLSLSNEAVQAIEGYEGMYAVKCVINEGVLPGATGSGEVATEQLLGYEFLPLVCRTKNLDTSLITDKMLYNKFSSFYSVKDAANPLLTEEGVAEMVSIFPNAAIDSISICDPEAKAREIAELVAIANEAGIAKTDSLVESTELDIPESELALLSALEYIYLEDGLTLAANTDAEIVTAAAPAVALESSLLSNAIREYFGLADDEALTGEMLAQVESIDFCLSKWNDALVLIPEYADKYAVKCVINGGALIAEDGTLLASVSDELYESPQLVIGYEVIPYMVRSENMRIDEIPDEWNQMMMNAFYLVRSVTNPDIVAALGPDAIAELLTMYPCLAISDISFCDPMTMPREARELIEIALEYNIANLDAVLDSPVIEISKNDITALTGLIVVNVGEGVTVEYID